MNSIDIKFNNEHEAGITLSQTLKKGFELIDEQIDEYDFQLIDDASVFLKIEQKKYLLINKIFIKKIYIHWRNVYFLSSETKIDQETSSLIVLLINPNFASAWSIRKRLVEKEVDTTNVVLRCELELNRIILLKNFKCEQAFVVKFYLVKGHTAKIEIF
jgi:hypothetical protein